MKNFTRTFFTGSSASKFTKKKPFKFIQKKPTIKLPRQTKWEKQTNLEHKAISRLNKKTRLWAGDDAPNDLFTGRAPVLSLGQERAKKIATYITIRKQRSSFAKINLASKGQSAKRIIKAKTQAIKTADIAGIRAGQRASKKMGLSSDAFKTTKLKTFKSRYKKSFLRDDDPDRALKSMRLDREGSHMKGLPTEPRKNFDPFSFKYKTYNKSQLLKMSRGEIAKDQKPFTNYEKANVMRAGKKGLSKIIDREIASPKQTTATFKHVIKHNIPIFKKGKKVGSTTQYSKAYGTFRVPSRKLGRARIATDQPTGKYVWRKGKKKKILLIE